MELWISISSVIIALSALAASIWQGYLQRKHSKLSVLPHITVEFDTRINSDIAVYIKSVGLGPAKFLSYKWVVNDKEIYIRSKKDFWDILNELGLENERVEFYCPQLESFLAPGFEGFLVRFPASASKPQHTHIVTALSKARIHILYESMYGDKVHDCHAQEHS